MSINIFFFAESVVKGDLKVTEDVSQRENEKTVNRTVINTNAFKDEPAPPPPVLQVKVTGSSPDGVQTNMLKQHWLHGIYFVKYKVKGFGRDSRGGLGGGGGIKPPSPSIFLDCK